MKTQIARFMIFAALLLALITYSSDFDAAQGQQLYNVIPLPTYDEILNAGISINNTGWIGGYVTLADGTMHAAVWTNQELDDLGTLGGPHSAVLWPVKNNKGLISGVAETEEIDPLGENWSCSTFFPGITHNQCLGFVWRDDVMQALPTLDGFNGNGFAAGANNLGQIVGWAENAIHDPACVSPQVRQFQAVIWGPGEGQIQQLPPFPGDTVAAATAINNNGQIVGISGICDQAVGRFSAIHAVLWYKGEVIDLKNIGSFAWNTPTSINQQGDIVGFVNIPGATETGFRPQAFIWTKKDGMQTLPMLPGDTRNLAYSINNLGQVVGESRRPGPRRAFLWHKGVMYDLNTLTQPGSLPLVFANDINDRGEITGQAFDSTTGEFVPFLAVPPPGGIEAAIANAQAPGRHEAPKVVLPERILKRIRGHVFAASELE